MLVEHKDRDGTPRLATKTNHAGGTLGGISSGAPIVFRVVSTIGRRQETATFAGKAAVLKARGRHDPCVLSRMPPLVEGMAALVLADNALIQRSRESNGKRGGGALVVIHPKRIGETCKLPMAQPRPTADGADDGAAGEEAKRRRVLSAAA